MLATHVYALDAAANASVMDRSVAAAGRDDAAVARHRVGRLDRPRIRRTRSPTSSTPRLLPWLYWSYNGHIVTDSKLPLVPPNLNVTGAGHADPRLPDGGQRHARRAWPSTRPPRRWTSSSPPPAPIGAARARWLQTVVTVPKLRYPDRVHRHRGRSRRDLAPMLTSGHAAQPPGRGFGMGPHHAGDELSLTARHAMAVDVTRAHQRPNVRAVRHLRGFA